jgi:glycosyltransferase 2 family protein
LAEKEGKIKDVWVKIKEQVRILASFNKKSLAMAFLFLFIHWVMGGTEFMMILRFMGVHINIFEACLIDSGVGFFKALGILIPGQLGVEEYGNKFMLNTVGVQNQEVWVTASILRRSRQIFWILFGVVVYFWRYGKQKAV